ncbi:homeodomain-like superfamily protein [Actinidia rufa]|uniref:Homeodomain-like superfamily protein n=1 Tax=Actinidia rufa TaxID=165716 RepID=A0A7J0GAJ4_9ERIC|nr:homeodomain-like superfamily protein [Actinidia rufa]
MSHSADCAVAEIMLFGVIVKVDPMRKSVSMNDLSQYEQPHESSIAAVGGGYASADDAIHRQSSGSRERKRDHKFSGKLLLKRDCKKEAKGTGEEFLRNFVKTRTPTQVASHAQKYFLRRNSINRRRRRSSLFDITTESVTAILMEEETVHQDTKTQPLLPPTQLLPPESTNISGSQLLPFQVSVHPVLIPVQIENPMEQLTLGHLDQGNPEPTKLLWPAHFLPIPNASAAMDVNLNQKSTVDPSQLSLKLSLSSDQNQLSRYSSFQVMSSFNNEDSIISVA